MRPDVDLSIVIVNFNAERFLRRCLCSIYENTQDINYEVWVVDNASTDGSLDMLNRKFPEVRVIANHTNAGFAEANNQAIKRAIGKYILLLNPDTLVVERALDKLVQFMEQTPDTGIIGPKVFDDEIKASVQYSCRRFPTLMNALFGRHSPLTKLFPNNRFSKKFLMLGLDHSRTMEVDWVSGCCLLIRRELLDQIGLLDEEYRLFFEDIDICYRAHKAKRKIIYYPKAHVVHFIGKSRARVPLKSIYNRHKSMKHFYDKYYRRGFLEGGLIIFAIYVRMVLTLLVAVFGNAIVSLRRKAK